MRYAVCYSRNATPTTELGQAMPTPTLYRMILERRPLRMRLLRLPPSSGQQLADYDSIRLTDLPDADCVYDAASFIDAGSYVSIVVAATWSLPDFSQLYWPRGCVLYTADTAQVVALANALGEGLQLPAADGGCTISLALVGVRY